MAETRRKPRTAPSTATERLRGTLLETDFPPLSTAATEFLRNRPQAARIAVAVALEAAARQSAVVLGRVTDHSAGGGPKEDLPDPLKPFVVDSPARLPPLGVTAAAQQLQVSRTTIYDWARKGTLLAWKVTRRGLQIPGEQILGPGKVIAGLPEVLEIIEDPELAWAFLTQEWPFEDETALPLDKLKAGQVREVVDAAPGFGAVFS